MSFVKKAAVFATAMLLIIFISGNLTHERSPDQRNIAVPETLIKKDDGKLPEPGLPVFPVSGDYEILSYYGFNNGHFSPYTVIRAKGTVVSLFAGEVVNCGNNAVTVRSQNVEIEYAGIKAAAVQNEIVYAGQKIGEVDGIMKIKGIKKGMAFDIIYEYFTDKSIIAVKQKNEEQQRTEYQKKKREMEIRLSARNSTERKLPADAKYKDLFLMASKETGIAPEILYSIAYIESGFNPKAVSKKGAMGIMQLMPETAESLGVKNPFDPKENITAGARYFKYLLERFGGDVKLALAAYNAGPNNVEKYNRIPPFEETQNYVKKVSAIYDTLTKQDIREE